MKAPQTHVFKTITELLEHLKQPKPLHPLIALVSYQATAPDLEQAGAVFMLDFYKISFKTRFNGHVRYGPGYYDFQEGGLAFLAPHQLVTMTASTDSYEGFALYFHPDLIRPYPLGKSIRQYHFFPTMSRKPCFYRRVKRRSLPRYLIPFSGSFTPTSMPLVRTYWFRRLNCCCITVIAITTGNF
ncbi:AraC family ligand binding domain-containing protein [Siphonobacter sp. BAB-5385]|uniref:AraC family ligand binding domain-containing protein n=1 Tax=Siphonobacter sp. BAB-5385 TaxID=1864822 RepID=UPI0020CF5205|nr:AraC family ligand binding domain-containing protein [Siphonobacter sp. BAB-5385]